MYPNNTDDNERTYTQTHTNNEQQRQQITRLNEKKMQNILIFLFLNNNDILYVYILKIIRATEIHIFDSWLI